TARRARRSLGSCFFFQAEDGIRDFHVTGVQTCALPICMNDAPRTVWTLDQSAPLGPQLYRILRQRIISVDLAPGSRLSEAEIAATYELSRQPVREAFIKLAEEGLLEVRPQ